MEYNSFHKVFERLAESSNYSDAEIARRLEVNRSTIGRWKSGDQSPPLSKIPAIAALFDVHPTVFVGGEEPKPYYELTEKDERDIAKDLERMLASLESNEALAFNGEPMDEETKRLFAISLENSMRLAKEMAKKKFTPKKYRD